MASLREIRNAIIADMHADGRSMQELLDYRDDFKQSVRCVDEQRVLYVRKERVEIITRLPLRK